MAKRMAMLEEGRVINLLWCSDLEPEKESLVNIGSIPVQIGDSFRAGGFFRNGEQVKSNDEISAEMQKALAILGVRE